MRLAVSKVDGELPVRVYFGGRNELDEMLNRACERAMEESMMVGSGTPSQIRPEAGTLSGALGQYEFVFDMGIRYEG